MKLKEWVDFNWQKDEHDHTLCKLGDFYIKVMANKSFKSDDVILSSLISPDNAKKLFGNMEVFSVGRYEENNYTALSVLIYQKEES